MAEGKRVNKINVDQLIQTVNQVQENPDLGQFRFMATNEWIEGTHCRATIKDFYGAGKTDDTREPRHYDMDEPPILMSENLGSNPVEYLLVALSGCITTTMIVNAAAKGIELRGVKSRYEGDIDLRGFMNISPDVPKGYKQIRVFFDIDADISDEQKQELIELGQKFSPVFNTIVNNTPVEVRLEEMATA